MTTALSPWLQLLVVVLANWRLAHLLAFEDGPLGLIARLRQAAGRHGAVLDCFYCMSLWVGGLLALWLSTELLPWLCLALANSGAACLLQRLGAQSVVMQALENPNDGEPDHGMLRTSESERRGSGQPPA